VLGEIGLRVHHAATGDYAVDRSPLLKSGSGELVASSDPELVFVNRPGFSRGEERLVEAHGILRPTDVAPTKPVGTLRLAVVGDSVGAATYLSYETRFSTLVERSLAADLKRPVQILNFSVDGYATGQEARMLETSASEFDVDAVLIVFCLNDAAESYQPMRAFRAPPKPASFVLDLIWTAARRAVGRPARPILLAPLEGPSGDLADHWRRMYDPGGDGWATVDAGFRRIETWSRGHQVPALVAIAPLLLVDDPSGSTTQVFRSQVANALERDGLPCVDLQSAFANVPTSLVMTRPDDIYHFNALGHQVLANALLPGLRSLLRR